MCNFVTKYSQNLDAHFLTLKHIRNSKPKDLKEDPVLNQSNEIIGDIVAETPDSESPELFVCNRTAELETPQLGASPELAKTRTPQGLKRHISMNHGKNDDSTENEDFEKSELSKETEVLVCSTCNFKGKNRKSISVHWTWNPGCKKGEFSTMPLSHAESQDHLNQSESKETTFKCELCNFETKYNFNLNAHYKTLKHISKSQSNGSMGRTPTNGQPATSSM